MFVWLTKDKYTSLISSSLRQYVLYLTFIYIMCPTFTTTMPRILLLIVLIWVVYVVVKRFIAKASSKSSSTTEAAHAQKIVACHRCGLHVPENESCVIDGEIYCNNPACYKQH